MHKSFPYALMFSQRSAVQAHTSFTIYPQAFIYSLDGQTFLFQTRRVGN